jgi:hypothetical protein
MAIDEATRRAYCGFRFGGSKACALVRIVRSSFRVILDNVGFGLLILCVPIPSAALGNAGTDAGGQTLAFDVLFGFDTFRSFGVEHISLQEKPALIMQGRCRQYSLKHLYFDG